AKTSTAVYKEVAKVMLLPDISYVYRKTNELISKSHGKAYSIHMGALQGLKERADKEGWSCHQRIGCLGQDSANVKKDIEHDHVSNKFVGCDESHKLGTLSKMFHSMAQNVKDAAAAEQEVEEEAEAEQGGVNSTPETQNSILDELRLAGEHLVFKFTSIDPDIKCSEVVASINVERVTPEIITTVQDLLEDMLPIYGLYVGFGASDAAGCNWVAYKSKATHSIRDMLPEELRNEYPDIDFDLKIACRHPVTDDWIIFIPDMPHLTKNIVTALEYSGSQFQKRNIKYGKCPMHLFLIQNIWFAMDGHTSQLQESKLSMAHFEKNAYSRMNVILAMQILSATVANMIRVAMGDEDLDLELKVRGMYTHLMNLCDNWNDVVDICNGKDGPHTKDNGKERQEKLLDVLSWFSNWKKMHDEDVADKTKATNEYNFFADETWFCIRALILAHVAAIGHYCLEKREKINPRSLNTDVVEWFFGDVRQMVGGSTDKMTARGWNYGDYKARAYNAGMHNLHGNNKTGDDTILERHARF
ncbi:hypothetical protein ACHAXR_005041, partial [Thalassiosira sp. AJA248-18]